MSNAAGHAAIFYKEVAIAGVLWTIRDGGGFPAPINKDGLRTQPFWSSISRANLICEHIATYRGFEPVEISWQAFKDKWVPGLSKDHILVGVNWSGNRATGYDVAPGEILLNVEHFRSSAR